MRQTVKNSHPLPQDIVDYAKHVKRYYGGIFAPRRDIFIARAPAQLEIMGGSARCSGSTVVEGTLKEATIVGLQKRQDRRIVMRRLGSRDENLTNLMEYHLDDLYEDGHIIELENLKKGSSDSIHEMWGSHVAGVFGILLKEGLVPGFEKGANIGIWSDLPLNGGVNFHTTLYIATMQALQHAFELELDPFQIARSCQLLGNRLSGKSTSIVDDVIATIGEEGKLLAFLCQPHEVLSTIDIPKGYQFVGLCLGDDQDVMDTRYDDMRVATYMSRNIIVDHDKDIQDHVSYGGYLCNITADEWQNEVKKRVPGKMSGLDYLNRYPSLSDPPGQIIPERNYLLRKKSEFLIIENDLSKKFFQLLNAMKENPEESLMIQAGQIMFDSHENHTKNGVLNERAQNEIVKVVKELGVVNGLYGARTTNDSRLLVILAAEGADDNIKNIAAQYYDSTKKEPILFFGSSPGANQLGVVKTQFE